MKKKNGIFKILLFYICLSCVIIPGLITIPGCGGGGDGGGIEAPPSISYTGLTTWAIIDENNAQVIATGSYLTGSAGSEIGDPIAGAVQNGEEEQIGRPRSLILAQALEKALRQVDVTSMSDSVAVGAIQSESGTESGTCGGSVSWTINYDDVTGDFTGSFNFDSYCEDGTTLSGGIDVSGTINLTTEEFVQISMSFALLTVTSGSDSFTADGDIAYDFSVSSITVTIDMLLQDNSTSEVFWIENFIMTMTVESDYVDVDIVSGRFYHPDYGYVVLSTGISLRFYYSDVWPSQGELICTGDGGTKARLSAISSTQYRVEADTNGDGTYDYVSEILLWSDLYGS